VPASMATFLPSQPRQTPRKRHRERRGRERPRPVSVPPAPLSRERLWRRGTRPTCRLRIRTCTGRQRGLKGRSIHQQFSETSRMDSVWVRAGKQLLRDRPIARGCQPDASGLAGARVANHAEKHHGCGRRARKMMPRHPLTRLLNTAFTAPALGPLPLMQRLRHPLRSLAAVPIGVHRTRGRRPDRGLQARPLALPKG
jgi:hypothetical protein